MVDVSGIAVFLFAFLLQAFVLITVVLTYFGPSNAGANTENALRALFAWLAVWVPATASQTWTNFQNHIASYYKWYLLALVLLAVSYGTYHDQPAYDKTADAWDTAVKLPFLNKFALPTANVGRMTWDTVICFLNVLANLGRIVWNQFTSITLDCGTMDWGAIPGHLGAFTLALSNVTTDVILSGFTRDAQLGPVLKHLANAYSELNPLFDCQCNDLNFLWPILIHPDYGMIQSPRLHYLPQAIVNAALELARKPVETPIGIVRLVLDGCPDRACEVAREPKFDRLADLTCQVFTHSLDFVDDAFFSIDSAVRDKLSVAIPWNRPPRLVGFLAMPLCATTDLFYGVSDALWHPDLFFTLPSDVGAGNYAAEFPTERILSRFHNMTAQIEAAGLDISGTFAQNLGCLVGRALNVVVSVFEFALISLRRLLATGFDGDAVKDLAGTAEIVAIVNGMESDVAAMQICLVALEDEVGPVLTPTIVGLSEIAIAVARIVREFTEKRDDLLNYFGGTGVQTDADQLFRGSYILAGAQGKAVRRLGAFGSVHCLARNVVVDPDNLDLVEMHLNIMCALGTTLEMALRIPVVALEHLVDGILAMARTAFALAGSSFDFEVDLLGHFVGTTAPFDIGRNNGFLEAQCLLTDSLAMVVPSLLTLPDTPLFCTNPNRDSELVADVVFNLFRASFRLIGLKPVLAVRAIFQAFTIVLCDSLDTCLDFSRLCEFFIIPAWKFAVVPSATVVIALIDTVDCFVPADNTLLDIATVVGQAFVDTDYNGGSGIVPCAEIANEIDGGAVVGFLCDFFATLTDLVSIVLKIFEKGFWQALWELVSAPIVEIINQIVEISECIWEQITDFFDTFADCVESIVTFDPETINNACDFSSNTCDFSFTPPEYNIDSTLPPPATGPQGTLFQNIPPGKREMVGSCVLSTDVCKQRPIGIGFANGYLRDYNGNDCALDTSAIPGANWLALGANCDEIEIDGLAGAGLGTGACCVPAAGCAVQTYADCHAAAAGNARTAVWVANETCAALNGKCNVVSSPYSTQPGCCVTDGPKDIFDTSVVRVAVKDTSAYLCYKSARLVRPFFVPGDPNCSAIEAHPIWSSLINASDATLDDLGTSPFVNATDLRRDCCTPEDGLWTTTPARLYDTACQRQFTAGLADAPVYLGAGSNGYLYSVATAVPQRIAGTDYFSTTTGSYWRCHSNDTWIRANSGENGAPVAVGACPFGLCPPVLLANYWKNGLSEFGTPQGKPRVLNHGNTIATLSYGGFQTTPFSNKDAIATLTVAEREARMAADFVVQCRWLYVGVVVDQVSIGFGPWQGPTNISSSIAKGSCVGAPLASDPYVCWTTDCQFRAVATRPVPTFDQCVPYQPALAPLDALSSTERTMGVLYFAAGPFSSLRDNTDARCNTYVRPDYSIPAAPAMYVEPVFGADDDNSVVAAASGLRRRRQIVDTFPEHQGNASHPAHPCYMIADIMAAGNLTRAETYLMTDHFANCHRSVAWSYRVESWLLYNSKVTGQRIIHPLFLYRSAVWDQMLLNLTRGLGAALSYSGFVITEYAHANKTVVPAEMISGAASWPEYAASQGVTDGLGLHVGGFITMLTQMVVAHDHQGRPVPRGLGVIGYLLSAAKWNALQRQPVNRTRTRYLGPQPPVFSEAGWQMLTNLFTLNWMNGTGVDYTQSALRLQRLSALKNFTSGVATAGLVKHGLAATSAVVSRPLCDPRDRSCMDCELVVGSAETLVEVILNCVEDLQDSDRFNIDISQVDLTRDNTFLQRNDTLKCRTPDPIDSDNVVLVAVFTFIDWIAGKDEGFARYWMARTVCYVTNFDDDDPHSFLFYFKKAVTCDPVTDGSAHRGRAGFGLRSAVFYVTLAFVLLILVSSLCLPIPVGWITVAIWAALVLMAAYWWSPACLIGRPPLPIPVIPDALADDLYAELRAIIPRNCTQYDASVTTPGCRNDGRTFVDCGEFGFDYFGARHLAYLLYSISPSLPDAVRDTSIPLFSSLMQTPYFRDAFSDVASVHGTPVGEYCYGLNDLSLSKTPPLVLSLLLAFLLIALAFIGLALVFFALALGVLLFILAVHALAAGFDLITEFPDVSVLR